MQTIRTFVTIKLPEDAIKKLAVVQRDLQRAGIKARFTAPTNLHLTLKFLGEVPVAGVGAIKDVLDNVAQGFEPFFLRMRDFNILPDASNPRILSAGLEGDVESLQRLAGVIAEKLLPWGFPEEKRVFRPHLTLARNPEPMPDLEKLLQSLVFADEISFTATDIYFYKSVLTPRGPVYSVLHQSPFKRPAK